MANKGFIADTFEKALEAGQSMAKGGVKQIKQTFDPLKMVEGAMGKNSSMDLQSQMKEAQGKKQDSTPLNFDKLQKSYDGQDKAKADAFRNRLFQMVKSGDEKVLMEKKQKEEEKKRSIVWEDQEKRRKEAEKQRQEQAGGAPAGKERKSILGGKKKKAQNPAPAEIKPSTGKQ